MTFSNGEQRLELRDTKGTTLGFFLSERELQEQAEEREALRKQVADLQSQLDAVAHDKKALREEVENYAKMLEVWERDGIAPMTHKELEQLRKDGIPFESVIAEIDALVRIPSRGA
jgi:predicted nuclease with TOPRIM domain